MTAVRTVVFALIAASFFHDGRAQATPPEQLVRAELLADVSTVKAGEPFTLGVLLQIEPGWHVYWTNPGVLGLPTAVKFTLPEGFAAGPLAFPTPSRFEQPGNEVGFGYEKQVLLTARVTPPKQLPPGDLRISAKARWLSCKDVCLPGSGELSLVLHSGAAVQRDNERLFDISAASVPVEVRLAPDIVSAEVVDGAKPDAHSIRIQWKEPPTGVDLFPTANDALSVDDIAVRSEGDVTRIDFKITLLKGQKLTAGKLPVVVGYSTRGGERRGVMLDVPLREGGKPQ